MKAIDVTCALILVLSALSVTPTVGQVINGSFETGAPGGPPSGWTVTGGNAVVQSTPSDLFPSHGSQYLKLDPGPTTVGAAGPTYGPHAAGAAGQVTQIVSRPVGSSCWMSVDWELFAVESLTTTHNDFLNICVVDNNTNALLATLVFIYVGASAGAPAYVNVPGSSGGLTWVPDQSMLFSNGIQAPAGFKRAWADLTAVPEGTPMRIEATLGNDVDSQFDSIAFIDRVTLSVGQQNTQYAAMRVLSSSTADGLYGGSDWNMDYRPEVPYIFRAVPGQRLSIRITGYDGYAWALVSGTLLNPGITLPGFGILNIDPALPYSFLIDGMSPATPLAALLGTIHTGGNYFSTMVPVSIPAGTALTLQALMALPSGFLLSAATTIEVGQPQMPVGGSAVAGGANSDNGFTSIPFATFSGGTWPFYGVARPGAFVGSNGFVSFGAGDAGGFETEASMMSGPARIAALWDDLVPPGGVGVRATETPSTFTASWTGLKEASGAISSNHFAIQMYTGGVFTIYFGGTTMIDGLCGISPGGLPTLPSVVQGANLSNTNTSLGLRGSVSATLGRFQQFETLNFGPALLEPNDLMTAMGGDPPRITFVPNGSGGYTYFTGTR